MKPDQSVVDAAAAFTSTTNGRKHSLAIVVDGNDRVLGVLSLGDIASALSRFRAEVMVKTVGDIMTTNICSAQLSDRLPEVMKRMVEHKIRHLPVIENGILQGLVTRKDALEGMYDEATFELKYLTEFVFRSGARY
jgi:CBS domain-containing protein